MSGNDERETERRDRPDVGLHIDAGVVMMQVNYLVSFMHKNFGYTVEKLAAEVGIAKGSLTGVLYPNRRRWISTDDLSKIIDYARREAEQSSRRPMRTLLLDLTNDVVMATRALFETEGLTPTEYALVQHLGIDVQEQAAFSNEFAGVYAALRFTAREELVVSRMDLRPRAKGGAVCRFSTSLTVSEKGSLREQQVDGYIYTANKIIYSIGRTADAGVVRSSILEPTHNRSGGRDLRGLRIAVSQLDGEPFAHRIHFRRIGDASALGRLIDGWDDGLFTSKPFTTEWRSLIQARIPDLDQIVEMLNRTTNPPMPWGLRLAPF